MTDLTLTMLRETTTCWSSFLYLNQDFKYWILEKYKKNNKDANLTKVWINNWCIFVDYSLFYPNHYSSLISAFSQGSTACPSPSRCTIEHVKFFGTIFLPAPIHLTKTECKNFFVWLLHVWNNSLSFLSPLPSIWWDSQKLKPKKRY